MSDLNRQISRLISLLRVECTKSRALKKGKEEPWADTAADGAAGGAATFEVKSFTKSWLTAGFMIAYVYIAGFVLIFLAKAAIGAAVELVARSNAFGLRSAIARERGIEAYRAWLPLERIRPAHIAQEEWEERFAWPANGKPPYPPLTYRMVRAALRACKRCGRSMSSVAEIAPFGGDPGLVALMCIDCGTTDSLLVHKAHKSQPAARSRVLERAAAMPI